MITFSQNPQIAERQMQAVIFYLTTFGYIDGDFDQSEREFISQYIGRLVAHRVDSAMPDARPDVRAELVGKYNAHFHEEFERIDQMIKALFTEAVAADEDQNAFVHSKLKLRCFEIFESFDEAGREELMATVDELLMADGVAHPAEVAFRAELAGLLEADLGVEMVETGTRPPVSVTEAVRRAAAEISHPFFSRFEDNYSSDRETLLRQIDADVGLLEQTIALFDSQRAKGAGRLAGVKQAGELDGQGPFLDGHVHVVPNAPGVSYDLTVLGDLHGCYSCLKAAVMQSRFFEKVDAFRRDPAHNPNPKLIMLGDYIDRGIFSLNGVLRAAMQLQNTAPDHVYMLRGNHENYFEYKGEIYGGVKPAEAIATLKPYVPVDILRNYIKLFDSMPQMLLLGGIFFVHGGIPRDLTIKKVWQDLSSLNHEDIRFQVMWSDPSSADVIPVEMQEQSARFPFGRLQAAAFLQRIGCHTIVRGHEKIDDGFDRTYDDENVVLLTLFSAGGRDNSDLPAGSGYRKVTPMALTITVKDGAVGVEPWAIEYQAYNSPEYNRFYEGTPGIEHRKS
jgi:hypothetical protein